MPRWAVLRAEPPLKHASNKQTNKQSIQTRIKELPLRRSGLQGSAKPRPARHWEAANRGETGTRDICKLQQSNCDQEAAHRAGIEALAVALDGS